MIGIRNLIDFLPYYFKAKDTYKDSSGKGILEKFLEVCGDYFTDNIAAVIGDTLEILDLDATTEYYLAYLWEILGQLPFANQREVKPFELTEAEQRALIKYGNAFLKIRGTREFFEVVARVYGWSVSITVGENGWEKDSIVTNSEVKYPYFDAEVFDDDNIAFDEYHRMKQCVNATFAFTGNFSDELGAQKALKAFAEKYVPFNVHPKVTVNGTSMELVTNILIEKWDGSKWVKAATTEKLESTLKFRVSLVDENGERYDDLEFYSAVSGSTSRVLRTSPYEFTVSNVKNTTSGDIYQFITLDNRVTSLTITTEAKTVDSYSISCSPSTAELPLVGGKVSTVVTGTINGSGANIYCLETGEVKASGSTWEFDTVGTYNFCLEANGMIKTSFKVTAASYHYEVQVVQASGGGSYTDNLTVSTSSLNNTRFIVKVTSNNPNVDPANLKARIAGTSQVYASGTTFKVSSYGTFTLEPIVAATGNKNATLTVTSNNLSFNTFIINREANPSIISNDKATTYADIQTQPHNAASAQMMTAGLAWQVQIPSGEIISVPYQGTVSGDYGTIQSTSVNTIKITSKIGGTYKAWPAIYSASSASWVVQDTRITEYEPDKLVIIADTETSAWSGSNTNNATYQLSESDTEAKFTLALLDTSGGRLSPGVRAVESGTSTMYAMGVEITKTDKGTYTYTLSYKGKTFTATLQVKDFELQVQLSCTPSTSAFQEGKASTKLKISANKGLALTIKEKDSGDIYNNGDTFTAYEIGEYTFIAMVDGQEFINTEGEKVTAKFKVTDLTAVTVEPEVIEWEANETDEREIVITAPSASTEWVIISS